MRDFGTPRATALRHLGLSELAALHLPAGSMGPKIDACARFTAETGHSSAIGALTDAAAVLEGSAEPPSPPRTRKPTASPSCPRSSLSHTQPTKSDRSQSGEEVL
jgi:hypothetical protein